MAFFPPSPTAFLVLADGTVFEGNALGASRIVTGEIVFTTNMTGYQEVLTDPSYKGQIVAMTYPLIGNYGIDEAVAESPGVMADGFIIHEPCARPSHWNSKLTLEAYLVKANIAGIWGIDTRALTRRLRSLGVTPGVLSTDKSVPLEKLVEMAKSLNPQPDPHLVHKVSMGERRPPREYPALNPAARRFRVVALDYGIKESIIRYLQEQNLDVILVHASATAEEIMAHKPDGLFLSNGPGDPATLGTEIDVLREVAGALPTFGICLGHQLLGHAFGAHTFKMKFGHRGGNHPILEIDNGTIAITTQNHGYALSEDSLAGTGLRVTHRNLNDGTVAGVRHETLPCFSVQYHPEAAPGPHDAHYLFHRFRTMLEKNADAQKN